MKIINNPPKKSWSELLKRPAQTTEDNTDLITQIFNEVRREGDSAIIGYTKKFDKVDIEDQVVSVKEFREAELRVPQKLKDAILLAKENISKFHNAQRTGRVEIETTPGVRCWQEKKPIEKIGLYVPGGTAPLFTTVLMLAVPANIAGCREIVLCTPPGANGKIDDTILYTAKICGLTRVIKAGGIQAIAGMTFGTANIPPVYKIFGPGNQFVTAAKQMATGFNVAIDMPAGPSELMVVADDSASPAFVASDLLSQAEHGADSQVLLISDSKPFLEAVSVELYRQLEKLPRRDIAEASLSRGMFISLENKEDILEMINEYAPEHLILATTYEDYFLAGVNNAGSVFLGNYSPESAGDYASGTNHTLPTHGYAKQYSGVNLDSFLKLISYQRIDAEGIKTIGPAVELMAEAEGLQAHKNAVSLRLKSLEDGK